MVKGCGWRRCHYSGSQRAIRKPDLWYHDGDHAVLMRSNLVCHDVRFDPIQTKYATDLTDEQWAAIAPLVAAPSPNGGRPIEIDRRAIVNALLYKHRTGCQWRMLPNDVPPMRGRSENRICGIMIVTMPF